MKTNWIEKKKKKSLIKLEESCFICAEEFKESKTKCQQKITLTYSDFVGSHKLSVAEI